MGPPLRTLATVLIVIVAFVNLAPMLGVVSAARLESLYGVSITDPNLEIAMRHRAILLGIVGGLLLTSAFHSSLRPAAFVAGMLSMLSYVGIVWLVGESNAELRKIMTVDIVASVMLLVAIVIHVVPEPAAE